MNTLNTLISSINENIQTNTMNDLVSLGFSAEEADTMITKFAPNYNEQAALFASLGDEALEEAVADSTFWLT